MYLRARGTLAIAFCCAILASFLPWFQGCTSGSEAPSSSTLLCSDVCIAQVPGCMTAGSLVVFMLPSFIATLLLLVLCRIYNRIGHALSWVYLALAVLFIVLQAVLAPTAATQALEPGILIMSSKGAGWWLGLGSNAIVLLAAFLGIAYRPSGFLRRRAEAKQRSKAADFDDIDAIMEEPDQDVDSLSHVDPDLDPAASISKWLFRGKVEASDSRKHLTSSAVDSANVDLEAGMATIQALAEDSIKAGAGQKGAGWEAEARSRPWSPRPDSQGSITPQAAPLSPRWKVPTAQVQLTQFQDSATSAAASLLHSSVSAQPPRPANPASSMPLPAALQRGSGSGSGAAAGWKAGPQTQQASAVVAHSGWTPSTMTARGGPAGTAALGSGSGGAGKGLSAAPGLVQLAAAGEQHGSGPGLTAVARPVSRVSPRLGSAAGQSMAAASPAILQADGSPTAYAAALQRSTLRLGLTDEQRRQSREQVAAVAAAQGSQADSGGLQSPLRAVRPSLEQLKDFKPPRSSRFSTDLDDQTPLREKFGSIQLN